MIPAVIWITFLMAMTPPAALQVFGSKEECQHKVDRQTHPEAFMCVPYRLDGERGLKELDAPPSKE